MTRPSNRLALISFTALLSACGPKPGPSDAHDTDTSVGNPKNTIADEQVDLSAVSAPKDLVVVGRWQHPGSNVDTLSSWAKLPLEWRKLLEAEQPGFERIVAVEAPIEFAVALDTSSGARDFPEPFAVFSVGLNSLEETLAFAREKGQPTRQVRAGVYRVGEPDRSPSCIVARAVGSAPARLVCGDGIDDLDALGNYATRGLPNESMGNSDLHVEVRFEPMRKRFMGDLRRFKAGIPMLLQREVPVDNPRFGRAMADAAHGLMDEGLALLEDADKLSLDARINQTGGVLEGDVSASFRGKSSWTVQTFVDAGTRQGPVPDMFWKLPADSSVATYNLGANPKRFTDVRHTLAELADGFLSQGKVPKRVRDQLVDIIELTATSSGAMVFARGNLVPSAPSNSFSDREREQLRMGLGWHLVGIKEKPATYKTYFDKLVKLYNDRDVQKLLQEHVGSEFKPGKAPTLKVRGARGLPRGSVAYELTIPGAAFDRSFGPDDKPTKGKPLSFVLILVPDGDNTWIGVSADEKVISDKLNLAVKPAKDKTLEGSAGLALLRTKTHVGGGFLALTMLGSEPRMAKLLATMPHHGESMVPFVVTVVPGANPKVEYHARIPKLLFEDVAAGVMGGLSSF